MYWRTNGTYGSTKERVLSLNSEIYRLAKLIEANGDTLDQHDFQIVVDENGNYAFTGSEGTNRNRFRADMYGKRTVDELNAEQKASSADTLMHICPDQSDSDWMPIRRMRIMPIRLRILRSTGFPTPSMKAAKLF